MWKALGKKWSKWAVWTTVLCLWCSTAHTQIDVYSHCVSNFTSTMLMSVERMAEDEVPWQTEQLVEEQLLPCVQSAEAAGGPIHFLLPVSVLDPPFDKLMEPYRQEFNARRSGGRGVEFDALTGYQESADIITAEYQNKSKQGTIHPGFLSFNAYALDLAINGVIQDLSNFLLKPNTIAWTDVLPAVRDVLAFYDGKVWSVPFESRFTGLLYRRDVLSNFSITPPQTWDELVEAVKKVNGTDMDGDGVPDWGACGTMIGLNPGTDSCIGAPSVLSYIFTTFAQARGLQEGSYFDAATMRPLLTSAAGLKTVELISSLLPYMHPLTFTTCRSLDAAFVAGQCAFGVAARLGTFKAAELKQGTKLNGKVGVSTLPGSTVVLDRATGAMKACTKTSCPLAEKYTLPNGTVLYVNKVAKLDLGLMLALNAAAPPFMQRTAFDFISFISNSKDAFSRFILNPNTQYGPVRASQLHVDDWVAAGYNSRDVQEFLDVISWTFASEGRNRAADVRVAGANKLWTYSSTLITKFTVTGELSGPEMLNQLQQYWQEGIELMGMDYFRQAYRTSIGWQPPAPPAPSSPAPVPQQLFTSEAMPTRTTANHKKDTPLLAGMVAMALAVGLGIVVVAAWLYIRSGKIKRLFGQVIAPRPGPATTLVVTDIQDSTALWEQLPMSVMDETLKLHHNCLRGLLQKFSGYESATEGDSFILAFHNAESALSYALEVQQQLLQLPWPSALLQEPLCRPIYAQLVGSDPACYQARTAQYKNQSPKKLPIQIPFPQVYTADKAESEASWLPVEDVNYNLAHSINSKNGPYSAATTLLCRCADAWQQTGPATMPGSTSTDAALIFRGARVRMGLHSGLPDGSVAVNSADDHRTHYTGAPLATAKLVADCGQGGVISLSHATYKQLPMESMWAKALVMHNGLHQLQDDKEPLHIYQAIPMALKGRLGYISPVRSVRCLEYGAFDAPVGNVVVCYMKILGLDTLQKWNQEVAKQSEGIFQKVAQDQLCQHGGYPVTINAGSFTAAFSECHQAVMWALQTLQHALHADWPEGLLESDLGQPLYVLGQAADGSYHNQLIMRGFRLRAGIHLGPVINTLQAVSGKVCYKGRVLQHAAVIADKATHQQVLCSNEVWERAWAGNRSSMTEVAAICEGSFKLKGVAEDVQVLQVRLTRQEEQHGITAEPELPVPSASMMTQHGQLTDLRLQHGMMTQPGLAVSDAV